MSVSRTISAAIPARMAASASSKAGLWIGRVLSGLGIVFLTFDATVKLLRLQPAVEATAQLGYPESALLTIGIIQVICLIAYLVPRTAILGAVLWTGYLGGAIASQLRVGNPLFSHLLFPIYVAVVLWGGLWLRLRGVCAPFNN
jgi:hypothetical protein